MVDSWDAALTVQLGEGFITKTNNLSHLEKHGLLDKDVLGFVNGLCVLVDEEAKSLSPDELKSLKFTLNHIMVYYQDGELYYYLLHAHGPDAINFRAWVHFASDTDWKICVRTFKDMPTSILEEYGVKEWRRRTHRMYHKDVEIFIQTIHSRDDIYGNDSLPVSMMEDILFQ